MAKKEIKSDLWVAKMHRITPMYVDDHDGYLELEDIESFQSFSKNNIVEYYTRLVLNEKTDEEKTTEQILKDAPELHEYLRTYSSLRTRTSRSSCRISCLL